MQPPERVRVLRPRAVDDDQTTWLMTFSDLVLQLFGFAIVGLAVTRAAVPEPPPAGDAAPPPAAVAAPATPAPGAPAIAGIDAADIRSAVALVDEAAARHAAPDAVATAPATAAADPPAPAPPPPRPPSTPEPGPSALDAQLAALAAAHDGDEGFRVTVRDSSLVFTLEDEIAFPSGSADLLPAAAPVLATIRHLATSLPDFTVDVAGHTDDVPIRTAAFPSNLELSLARAARVARDLAGDDPALRGRVVVRGWGEFRPLATNDDPAGRARNRRVEIRLVPAAAG